MILFYLFDCFQRAFTFLKKIIFAGMKVKLIAIGKTDDKSLHTLIEMYTERLQHYIKFELTLIPDIKNVKNLTQKQQKEKEGSLLLNKLQAGDQLIILDEKGKDFRSIEFSTFLQKKMNSGIKQLVFVIGGPYGFSEEVYKKAQGKVSLSKMTFSHQMIRLFFTEQLYRAFTILKNEPYHHE
jgi:23S rRNA (pseudouridine1915-N3)-methyltransferase